MLNWSVVSLLSWIKPRIDDDARVPLGIEGVSEITGYSTSVSYGGVKIMAVLES